MTFVPVVSSASAIGMDMNMNPIKTSNRITLKKHMFSLEDGETYIGCRTGEIAAYL
jgi:hypothetical protein